MTTGSGNESERASAFVCGLRRDVTASPRGGVGRKSNAKARGRRIEQIIGEVATYLCGWRQYFNYAYNKQMFRELTAWIKRRLRCTMWKQWGRAGYRELRKRGVSRDLAWNTCKSHHGPWRLSRSPALAIALTTGYFVEQGLPLLHVNV